MIRLALAVFSLLVSFALFAADAPHGDPRTLCNDANAIIQRNSVSTVAPEEYAQAILKLEQAQSLLEGLPQADENLEQEVGQALYWAHKCATVRVITALEKLKGTTPAVQVPPTPPKKADPVKPPPPPAQPPAAEPGAPAEAPPALAEAKKAFDAAQRFVNSHSANDYQVAMCWFQMANQHPGTDYSYKAFELARAAQKRFIAKNSAPAAASTAPETPEQKLISDGDTALASGKFEEACDLYKASIQSKETILAHRRYGAACYARGQALKDDLMPKLDEARAELYSAYKSARRRISYGRWRFDPTYEPYVRAKREWDKLCAEGRIAIKYYDQAKSEYQSVLKMSPGNRDLEAAAYAGLCMAVRGDSWAAARQYLATFLSQYKPETDTECSLYAYCQTELNRIRK